MKRSVIIPPGSPIQTAGIKTCRFALFSKTFSEFECCKFENRLFGTFSEPVYAKVFIFQYIKRVRISLGLWDTFFVINQIWNQSKRKVFDFDDNKVVVLYHSFNKSSEWFLILSKFWRFYLFFCWQGNKSDHINIIN